MLIRITRPFRSHIGGWYIDALEVGEIYRATVRLAMYLLVGAYTTPVRKDDGAV